MKHVLTEQELLYRQSLPLEIKIPMSRERIRSFVDEYGTDGVYVSFSGGLDSTVLLHLCRKYYPDIKAVYCDTWMEFPQIRAAVKTYDNVDYIKPTMSMKDIVKNCGWCFPSKDVAEMIEAARRDVPWAIRKLNGLDGKGNYSEYRQQYKKWLPLYESEHLISPFCCDEQKEKPVSIYERETGRHPIMGLIAEESARRKESYLRTGCNAFNAKRPKSTPIAFWTKQDILQYIIRNNIAVPEPYGQIVEVGQIPGQMSFCQSCKLETTGEDRTGCIFCLVSAHLDNFAKINRVKAYNPKLYDYCMQDLEMWKMVEFIQKHYIHK